MRYNPQTHKRRSIRLRGYDYATPGAYFVTVCTYDRRCTLGEVRSGVMQLNNWGQIVADAWAAIPNHFVHATLDAFVVVPNHVHGVVWLGTTDDGGESGIGGAHVLQGQVSNLPLRIGNNPLFHGFAAPLQHASVRRDVPGAVGMIVRSFKSAVTKRINESRGTRGMTVWQRNFYEHIIRDQGALDAIRHYIRTNPANWTTDTEYRVGA